MLIKIRIYNSKIKYVRNNFFFRWQNITWNRRWNFQNISSVTTSKWNWQKRKLRIKLYAKIKSFRLDKYPHDKIYAPPISNPASSSLPKSWMCRVTFTASTTIKKRTRVSWCASWKACTSLKVPLEENSSGGGGSRRVGRISLVAST